jgi:hypothetical protein
MSHIVAFKVLKRLREEQPELLLDAPAREEVKDLNLDKVSPNTAPSELKKLSDQIARNRLTAPGLSRAEAQNLVRRIGH